MARKSDATLGFDALSIEGGLLSPVWLGKVAQLQAGAQEPGDYRIPKGLTVRDEIGRFWRIAQAHWAEFKAPGGAARQALAERFVTAFLREVLGFVSLATSAGTTVGGRSWPVRHCALGGRVPVIIAPAGAGLEAPDAAFGDEGRRRTPFGLLQEFLNAEDRALWGIASDGRTLRIARDNASLTRPAWIEADLASIFTDERYADFAALWLLAHESRFGAADRPPTDCPLEIWRNSGREEGTRARERLREGVEDALLALGNGFLGHADNSALRESLRTNALTRDAFFQQLLRMVYRLIFLITAEERGVLHAVRDTPETRRYAEGYSLRRLRERSVRRSAHDRFSDLWQGLLITLRGLAAGETRLALPALAGLFARDQCADLDAGSLENRALLQAVYRLCWLRDDAGLVRVNWRDMGPEELGSVYESLLELVPRISPDGRTFSFTAGNETRGNARKSSGSYYTPDSLVQVLLDSALEPVVGDTIARNPGNAVEALLSLSIVDPACGSGHFLLAAARRVAVHVARLQANGTPSPPEYRHALRQVVGRCVYGVDLNPMAVELCKVSLWMEAVDPGLPLTFLDSHIQQGNALLGATPELIATGVPDAAWEPIEGDDKKIASALKKRNKKGGEGQRAFQTLWAKSGESEAQALTRAVSELEAASDMSADALAQKESRWGGILASAGYRHQKLVADTWCAAFVWPKQPGALDTAAPTNDLFLQVRDAQGKPPAVTVKMVCELAAQYRFFHWHLQFPQVVAHGGFDVVLGNPPWERLKIQEDEFFSSRSTVIAEAADARARKSLIADLSTVDPDLWLEWSRALRMADGQSLFSRTSGRFPLTGAGDINTYALFAEHNRSTLAPTGRAGFIVPTGIATDETTRPFFETLIRQRQLCSLYDFENREGLFRDIDSRVRFSLIALSAAKVPQPARFLVYGLGTLEVLDDTRVFSLTLEDFELVSPGFALPAFRNARDAAIAKCICRRAPALSREASGWKTTFFKKMFDAGIHAADIVYSADRPDRQWVELYEAKMVHHFDHRAATYEGVDADDRRQGKARVVTGEEHEDPDFRVKARAWVTRARFAERMSGRPWAREWFVSVRDVARATDERTAIFAIRPRLPAIDKLPSLFVDAPAAEVAFLYGCLTSFALDYVTRQRVGGTNVGGYIIEALPALPRSTFDGIRQPSAALSGEWLLSRILELSYTAWDLEPFARDVGYHGPPFRWDPGRRELLRAELDAAFFHLYGLSRDDAAYVMDTFPIVRKNDEKAHGEYRTKRLIIEIYDELAEAIRTDRSYQTRLDPPPADPRVAHPPRNKPERTTAGRG